MMVQLVVGITMLRTDHATKARITSGVAIGVGLYPMPDAFDRSPILRRR